METLRDSLALMTHVVVVRGNWFDPTPVKRRQRPLNDVLAHVDDPAALDRLARALVLADVQDPMAWIASGTTLALHADGEHLGSVTALGGEWVRSTWWPWDMVLRDPELLDDWLGTHVPGWVLREP